MVEDDPVALALAAMDDLAARGSVWAAPAIFGIAHTSESRDAVYRLRFHTIAERGWENLEQWPDGRETDSYDEGAIHIAGWDGETLIATNRIVLPRADRPLPTERAFGVTVEPRGRVVDWNRTIVRREVSCGVHRAFAGLLSASWIAMREHGYHEVCGDFSATVIRLYRSIGIEVKKLGPAIEYWGEQRYPIQFDLLSTAPALNRWLDRVSSVEPTRQIGPAAEDHLSG